MWLYLEITDTCLVAGDFFVQPEELRHVPRTSLANFPTNVLRGSIFIPEELLYSKASKAINFTINPEGILFLCIFLKILF